jgi:hypothetical protein
MPTIRHRCDINYWKRSVEEAIQALRHHETQQGLNSFRFFVPFYAAGRTSRKPQARSSDEDYSTQSDITSTSTTTFTSFMTDSASVTSTQNMMSHPQ